MKKHLFNYLLFFAFPVFWISCSNQYAGIEITNGTGNCSGTIYNPDSTVASGAVVRLVPSGYNPSSPSGQIDSAITNEKGYYTFNVAHSDFYSILAQKGNTSCFIDSVAIQKDFETFANGVLKTSGMLKGTVTVKNGDSPLDVIILIWGTNIYTAPDSTGHFQSPALPSGKFNVQIIYTKHSEYNAVDTLIEILQGATSILDVTLPSTNAPTVEKLTITYDSALMYASLTWIPVDTTKISYYSLYRNSILGKDTTFMLEKSDSSFSEDLLFNENDTVIYTIHAIGKNYKEGYGTVSKPITPSAPLVLEKVIRIKGNKVDGAFFKVDSENVFTIADYNAIHKFNQNGDLLNSYYVNEDSVYYSGRYFSIQSDCAGNFYWLKVLLKWDDECNCMMYQPSIKIVKLDKYLHPIREVELPDSFNNSDDLIGFMLSERLTLNIANSSDSVIRYDTNLTLIDKIFLDNNDSLFKEFYFDDVFLEPLLPAQIRSYVVSCYTNRSSNGLITCIYSYQSGYHQNSLLFLCTSEHEITARYLLRSKFVNSFIFNNHFYQLDVKDSSMLISNYLIKK